MTIGRKIAVVSGTLLGVNIAMGVCALVYVGQLERTSRTLVSRTSPAIYAAGRINTGAKAILMRIYRHMSSSSSTQMAKFEAYLTDRNVQLRKEVATYRGLLAGTGREQEMGLIEKIVKDLDRVLVTWQEVKPLSLAMQKQHAIEIFEHEGVRASDDLDEAAKELVAKTKAWSDMIGVQSDRSIRSARFSIAAIMTLATLLNALLAFFMIRGLKRDLRRTVEELSLGAAAVLRTADGIDEASRDLAKGAAEQAASLEETSACSTQINAAAHQNAASSQKAVELVGQSRSRFEEASQGLEQLEKAVGDIDQSSGKIAKIIHVIDNFAFQTNILALNAAVEAARAGESGLGFAVVADEVRNLAQRSGQAARETSTLIDASIASSAEGRAKMAQVMTSIRAVADVSQKVRVLVSEVSAQSEQQAIGVEQVAKALSVMEQITQRTASSADQGAVSARSLHSHLDQLRQSLGRLTAMVG